MKAILFFTVLIISSCGKLELPADSQLNSLNSVEIIKLGSDENLKIKEVCDAVQAKSLTLSSLVNTDYVFSGTVKNCGDSSFTNLPDSTVKLVNQTAGFKFNEGANLFYFSEVETSEVGVLSLICDTLADLKSPIVLDDTNYLYFTATDFSSSDCLNQPDERCVKIERAIKTVTDEKVTKGRVHTREWIKIRLEQPRIGFFTYRKLISEAGCLEGENFGRTATLK